LYGRFIREHKAGAPMLERLIRMYGGDPAQTGVLKPAMLSDDLETMVRTMEQAHERAVMTSQMRYAATDSAAIQRAMHMRANMARKHLRLMQPYDR